MVAQGNVFAAACFNGAVRVARDTCVFGAVHNTDTRIIQRVHGSNRRCVGASAIPEDGLPIRIGLRDQGVRQRPQ